MTGTFGMISGRVAVVLVLLVKFAALAEVLGSQAYALLVLAPVLGRMAVTLVLLTTPYVRVGGLGSELVANLPRRAAIGSAWGGVPGMSLAPWASVLERVGSRMGLDVHGTRFLLYARGVGASFERTAMIGRQTLHLSAAELRRNLAAFGFAYPLDAVHDLCRRNQGFAEPFLEVLGARAIRSFDASAYEHATDIVDLNVALAHRYKGQFTAVIDGGSLEHVFNFPTALQSCMEMLAIGGHFLSIVPCNNFLGHGFYQFSPELFFRAFGDTNGFEVRKLFVFEDRPGAPWFEVADPARARRRVELANRWPTYLAVLARKDRETALFTQAVYQSDYARLWEERPWDSPLWRLGRRLMRFVPTPLRVLYGAIERRGLLSRYDPKVFTKAKLP